MKPKRTWQQTREGHAGIKKNNKDCNQGRTLWAEEQVRRAFRGQTTEAKRIDSLTKAKEQACSVKDTMGHLPTKIQNQMVQRKEVKLAPSRWPLKATIQREKLQNTVGRRAVFRQQKNDKQAVQKFC